VANSSIRGWCESTGKEVYPIADKLTITADFGESNGYRRLFSFISQNWRRKPLVSYEVIISLFF